MADENPPSASDSGVTPTPPVDTSRQARRPRSIIYAACRNCRERKVKCDGVRPQCTPCQRRRNRLASSSTSKSPELPDCTYDIEPGETRTQSLRKQNLALEDRMNSTLQLIAHLRSLPKDAAHTILHRINDADDLVAVMDELHIHSTHLEDLAGISAIDEARIRDELTSPEEGIKYAAKTTENVLAFDPTGAAGISLQSSTFAEDSTTQAPASSIPVTREMEIVCAMHDVTPMYHADNPLPSEDVTTVALEAFSKGSGALLRLWTLEDLTDLKDKVYHGDGAPEQLAKLQLSAASAVGSYCDDQTAQKPATDHFLKHFISLYMTCGDLRKLCRMRLSTCLAMCCIVDQPEAARILMHLALCLGREALRQTDIPGGPQKSGYWRAVFQSVVFLESWFAYNTNRDSQISEEDIALYRTGGNNVEFGTDTFHSQISELGEIAAQITVDMRNENRLSDTDQIRMHLEMLNIWHRRLPPPAQLRRLNNAQIGEIAPYKRRSILHLHTIFLGLFAEPHRNGLAHLGNCRISNKWDDFANEATAMDFESQCISAARQGARVTGILHVDNLLLSHCWISIYTSFTGCAVLLYGASQRLLSFQMDEVGQNLSYASSFMDALSLCKFTSGAAKELYRIVQPVFNNLREMAYSPTCDRLRHLGIVISEDTLATTSPSPRYEGITDEEKELCKDILEIARGVLEILADGINV